MKNTLLLFALLIKQNALILYLYEVNPTIIFVSLYDVVSQLTSNEPVCVVCFRTFIKIQLIFYKSVSRREIFILIKIRSWIRSDNFDVTTQIITYYGAYSITQCIKLIILSL